MGRALVMGRLTFESIGKALPGRRNMVLTRSPDFRFEGVETFDSLGGALAAAGDEAWVIGGRQVYEEALPLATRLQLTLMSGRFQGDVWFPPIPRTWGVVSSVAHPASSLDPISQMSFTLLPGAPVEDERMAPPPRWFQA
jgi:dihydrofolate reductase